MKEFVRFLADAPGITRNCGVIGTEGVCLNARSLMLSTGSVCFCSLYENISQFTMAPRTHILDFKFRVSSGRPGQGSLICLTSSKDGHFTSSPNLSSRVFLPPPSPTFLITLYQTGADTKPEVTVATAHHPVKKPGRSCSHKKFV